MGPERISVEEEGEVIPCIGTGDRKRAGTLQPCNSGKSGTKNLEAVSFRRKGESTRGCVKLKGEKNLKQE